MSIQENAQGQAQQAQQAQQMLASGLIPSHLMNTSLEQLSPRKKDMLTQTIRNALNVATDIGRHRTIGGEDTALRFAIHGLADGIVVEFFETLRMVDYPDIPSLEQR